MFREPETVRYSIPHNVDTVTTVDKLTDVKIDEAFLGTCTNGRLSDLEIGARILKNREGLTVCAVLSFAPAFTADHA